MATNVNSDGASSFKIKRPRITTNGFISQVDPTIKKTLAELNELLSKRVITPLPPVVEGTRPTEAEGRARLSIRE
jgi:hypothetical protein